MWPLSSASGWLGSSREEKGGCIGRSDCHEKIPQTRQLNQHLPLAVLELEVGDQGGLC